MPIKNLYKVQKHLTKRKGQGAVIHENSRDSRRLQRAAARDDKLSKNASQRAIANQHFVDRVSFCQQVAAETNADTPLPTETIQQLIQDYLARDEDELATIKAERRPGRPASTREGVLKARREREEKEYESGFWIPDLQDEDNLKALNRWNQEWVSLSMIRFVRLSKNGIMNKSTFPPKGMS